MLGGIALLSIVTASIVAWFVKHFSALEAQEAQLEAEVSETSAALADIKARLERIEARIGRPT